MCLILVAWQAHPAYPLIVAANRDEFHARSTAVAGFWPDAPTIFGGRDLEAGGTWLGLATSERFAAVTNVREPGAQAGRLSRGALTHHFLAGDMPASAYAAQLDDADYAGFNLLLADGKDLIYRSNRGVASQVLAPGIYGLSNRTLDTPWPKLITARQRFAAALPALPDDQALFALLSDRSIVSDADLPNTGVPLDWERLLSAIFVQSENYGTRASTVVTWAHDGQLQLRERSFDAHGRLLQSSEISTSVKQGT
jgi:uncharacterized protein with NRDE domain